MPTTPNLLSAFRSYLVDEDLVRVPATAGLAHPLWLEPQDGAPAPGEGQKDVEKDDALVLSAFLATGIPRGEFEAEFRTDIIDVWIRSAKANIAHDFEPLLRTAIIGERYGKRDWMMGDVRVIESREWRAMQRLGSSAQGFTFVISYLFERYAHQD